MPADVFARTMNEFYRVATRVLIKNNAFIDKFVGDEVMAIFLPVFCGPNHALAAIEAARGLVEVTAHGEMGRLPLGVGVNTGQAYFGTVKGVDGTFADVTALGDPVNVAARLGGAAAAGEALISAATCKAAGVDLPGCEPRMLALKGKSEPTGVSVMRAGARSPVPDVSRV